MNPELSDEAHEYGDTVRRALEAALEVIPPDATAIGGLTMGADAVAFGVAAVAATRGRMLRSFSVRKEVKDHGGGGRIAGALEPGDDIDQMDRAFRARSMANSAARCSEIAASVVSSSTTTVPSLTMPPGDSVAR